MTTWSRKIQALLLTALVTALPTSAAAQDVPIEQELRDLKQMVIELQQVVEQQSEQMKEQQLLIEEMREQMHSPETAARLAPHIDKHLLHERADIGKQLGDLSVAAALTGIVQGSIDAEDLSGEKSDTIDGSWSADFEIESPIGERGHAFILIEAGQGEGLTDELALLYHNVNDDALDSESRLEISEAWYQHSVIPERLTLVAGKLDMTNYFDTNEVANDERYEFLNSALVNSIAVEFPDNGPGAVATAYPADWVEMAAGWGKSEWEDLDRDGFGIAQLHFKPLLLGRPGNYRFYAWLNHSDKPDFSSGNSDDGWGAGISFDQAITDYLTAFLRFGFEDDDVYEVEKAWSAGFELAGQKWGREGDVAGVALAQALINDDVEPDDTETLVEAYYSIALNEWLRLSPDIQLISNPGGNDDNDTIIILGTRAQVDF
ncbi:MAG: hypothetical protein C4520_02605 [Candidatus Abyssobacteria bacterium SURF_5]|uniref:Porin n=1 Tax=Abyssobacteria bacterium (strain SURF_5) TaxID=2093360 RepID=A0A3A4PBK1_ABYX5|nr:MAG: hypothetical protein C4520_02605 [Candidatus Abyssubacteria bacterium SURF_5]